MPSATTVTVRRDAHTVRFVGDPVSRADFHVEWGGPGVAETDRSSRDSLMGEMGFINLLWNVDVVRETPHRDDQFPLSMPATIANMTVYGREDRTDGLSPELPLEYAYMDHLHVQPEARGMGFGQLLWDCYLAIVAHIDGDAHGKVGDDSTANTTGYLQSQGVPREDITHRSGGGWLGSHTAIWKTDGENVMSGQPVTVERVGGA